MLLLCDAYCFFIWNKRLAVIRLLHLRDLNSASTGEVVGDVCRHVQVDMTRCASRTPKELAYLLYSWEVVFGSGFRRLHHVWSYRGNFVVNLREDFYVNEGYSSSSITKSMLWPIN